MNRTLAAPPWRSLKETVAKPIVDDVLMAVQQDDGKTPVRLSRGSPSRALPRVALDLATTVERIQSVRRFFFFLLVAEG